MPFGPLKGLSPPPPPHTHTCDRIWAERVAEVERLRGEEEEVRKAVRAELLAEQEAHQEAQQVVRECKEAVVRLRREQEQERERARVRGREGERQGEEQLARERARKEEEQLLRQRVKALEEEAEEMCGKEEVWRRDAASLKAALEQVPLNLHPHLTPACRVRPTPHSTPLTVERSITPHLIHKPAL